MEFVQKQTGTCTCQGNTQLWTSVVLNRTVFIPKQTDTYQGNTQLWTSVVLNRTVFILKQTDACQGNTQLWTSVVLDRAVFILKQTDARQGNTQLWTSVTLHRTVYSETDRRLSGKYTAVEVCSIAYKAYDNAVAGWSGATVEMIYSVETSVENEDTHGGVRSSVSMLFFVWLFLPRIVTSLTHTCRTDFSRLLSLLAPPLD